MSNKIDEVEKSVRVWKKLYQEKQQDSIASMKEQIKSEVEHLMKIQPCIKTEKYMENKTTDKVTSLSLIHI